jgi:hypothetical protein
VAVGDPATLPAVLTRRASFNVWSFAANVGSLCTYFSPFLPDGFVPVLQLCRSIPCCLAESEYDNRSKQQWCVRKASEIVLLSNARFGKIREYSLSNYRAKGKLRKLGRLTRSIGT